MTRQSTHRELSDSGVGWLGKIPSEWRLIPVKRLFRLVIDPAPEDHGMELLSLYTDIGVRPRKDLEERGNRATTTDGYFRVKKGDFIFNKLLAWMGAIGLSNYDGVTSPAYDILRPTIPMVARYYDYLFRCGICLPEFRRHSRGIMDMRLRLYFDKLGPLLMPYPPLDEQVKITEFLDHETAKIDALTESYQQLLSRLNEELTSLVLSSASSGRSHKMRLGNAARVILRPAIQREDEAYTPIGLYNRGRGLFHKDQREMEEMGDSDFFWIEAGDLIISGQFAWEGAVALAGTEDSGCVVSHRYHVLRGIPGIALTEYLLALLSTELGDFLLNENSRGAAGRNRPLNINSLLKEEVSVPDLQTQQEVASLVHLKAHVQEETEKQVQLLKEYRSALVAAAVTGQIDVDNYRPQEAAAACQ